MDSRARENGPLDELVEITVKYCRLAEKSNPRRGLGRRPETADWASATMIAVAILQRHRLTISSECTLGHVITARMKNAFS